LKKKKKKKKKEEKEKKEELNEYSDGVQKRIAKLTRKMREAERQKEEAIQYAKTVYESANQIKQRYQTLDENYNKEFEDRIKSSMQNSQAKLREAITAGDIDAQVAAQTEIAGFSDRVSETWKDTRS
jgi:chromosome segregation ATPase